MRNFNWVVSGLVVGALMVAAFVVGWELRYEYTPVDQPQCGPDDAAETIPQIAGPAEGEPVVVGTVLQWYRTGHDVCGGTGANKRYTVALCARSLAGICNRANGFYNASVSPEDLVWHAGQAGSYTVNADDIAALRERAALSAEVPLLPHGTQVYFQIRYDYDAPRNEPGLLGDTPIHHFSVWDKRALTLGASLTPVPAPPAPALETSEPQPPDGPFKLNWAASEGATHYRVQLAYRMGTPGGTDAGNWLGNSRLREFVGNTATFDVTLPIGTSAITWQVAACNTGGCSQSTALLVPVDPPMSGNYASFAVIEPAFRAPSCINCHAVVPTEFETRPETDYEDPDGDNFGVPPDHPIPAREDLFCASCHRPLPPGPHVILWSAPEGMDFRGRSSAELCAMAKDRGTIAEDVKDHLLGDPLILWAVSGGLLPYNRGPTDDAFNGDWEAAVTAWVDGGMHCE